MIFGQRAGRVCAAAAVAWITTCTVAPAVAQSVAPRSIASPARDYLASTQSYWEKRNAVMASQHQRFFSADVSLSAEEQRADDFLETLRAKETAPYQTNGQYPPTRQFFDVKSEIERSETFRFLRKMPKGGALHLHWPAIGPVSWIISNATYRPDCFIRWSSKTNDPMRGQLIFRSKEMIATNGIDAGFVSAKTLRAQLRASRRSLDEELRLRFMLHPGSGPTSAAWNEFGNCFERLWNFATFEPLFRDYLTAGIESFFDDEVHYLEIRTPVVSLTDVSGHQGVDTNFLKAFREVRNRIRATRPDFNLKIIVTDMRDESEQDVSALLTNTTRYQQMFPDLVVGCDLVGNEDTGFTTQHFVPQLCAFAYTNRAWHFFFHDGESSWPSDNNIIDAVLLGSKRIGHGFNLFRWPEVEEMIRRQNIVLEVCPISNQALGLLRDLRMHPASGYLRRGVQCVLSSDDPALIGNHGLSYDFWEAFMAWNLHVPALKQLAENSLTSSAMTDAEREVALVHWRQKWKAWIAWVNEQGSLPKPAH
jgi:adenosine deaminase CECR1